MRPAALAGLTAVLLSGCGAAVDETRSASTLLVVTPADVTSTSMPSSEMSLPPYGVEETTRVPVTPGELTCSPDTTVANPVQVRGADPGAPTALIGIPAGFTEAGTGPDGVLHLAGPDQMTASISISPTTLEPMAAFQAHAEALTAGSDISSLSVLPGDECGYSGQKMMGSLSDGDALATEFADRVVHVWTAGPDYLVVIHLQGPTGAAGFDDARTALLADFGIRMPG